MSILKAEGMVEEKNKAFKNKGCNLKIHNNEALQVEKQQQSQMRKNEEKNKYASSNNCKNGKINRNNICIV